MRAISLILLFLLFDLGLNAQERADDSILEVYNELIENLQSGLQYLEHTQRKETIEGCSYKGEWQSQMCMQKSFFLLGGKKDVDDSNCFAVASIHNALASIYLIYPEYETIPKMLDLSFKKIMTYRNGNRFNFWNLLPPNRSLSDDDVVGEQPLVRRPTNFKLKTKYINNAANVVEDADDTSLAYAAIALRKKYKSELTDSFSLTVKSIEPIFGQYRDKDRNNRHWFNFMFGNDHDTEAYLTWLADEYQFKRWNFFKAFCHNASAYLPFSQCYPHPYVPYLPYGSNDLDGVVNANVLTALSYYDELDSEGAEAAIRFIEKKSKRAKYDRVGIYYPNRYHFPYAVSKAYASGVRDLQLSTEYIHTYLLKKQNRDGSWSAKRRVNKKDKLQSTAYALNALLYIGKLDDENTRKSINAAMVYIMKHAITDDHGVHWEGGVFFSGGTVVRNFLVWKSDAYTTSIILTAFANYRKHLEEKYDIVPLKTDRI